MCAKVATELNQVFLWTQSCTRVGRSSVGCPNQHGSVLPVAREKQSAIHLHQSKKSFLACLAHPIIMIFCPGLIASSEQGSSSVASFPALDLSPSSFWRLGWTVVWASIFRFRIQTVSSPLTGMCSSLPLHLMVRGPGAWPASMPANPAALPAHRHAAAWTARTHLRLGLQGRRYHRVQPRSRSNGRGAGHCAGLTDVSAAGNSGGHNENGAYAYMNDASHISSFKPQQLLITAVQPSKEL